MNRAAVVLTFDVREQDEPDASFGPVLYELREAFGVLLAEQRPVLSFHLRESAAEIAAAAGGRS